MMSKSENKRNRTGDQFYAANERSQPSLLITNAINYVLHMLLSHATAATANNIRCTRADITSREHGGSQRLQGRASGGTNSNRD